MKRFVLAGLLVSFAVAGVLSHFASRSPDGLETAMARAGVEEGKPPVSAPFPDYQLPVLGRILGRTVPALAGTALAFLLILLLLRALARRRPGPSPGEGPPPSRSGRTKTLDSPSSRPYSTPSRLKQ